MQGVKNTIEKATENITRFKSFDAVYGVARVSKIKYWFWGIITVLVLILFLPWTQNIRARGKVTTLRQEERPQELNTIIGGRITKWYVKEGDFVKKGDTILQLAEIKDDYLDPALLQRTREQLDAKKDAVSGYKGKVGTVAQQIEALKQARDLKISELNNKLSQQLLKIQGDSNDLQAASNDLKIKLEQYKRQKNLYDAGLASLVQLEQRNQAVQDATAKKTSASVKLSNAQQEYLRIKLELNGEQQQYLEKISKAEGDRFQSLSQIATSEGEISKLENQYMNYNIRSGQYYVKAPQDGQIVQARKSGLNEIVKEGEKLVEIIPTNQQYAVELFVKPVDLPLVANGQKVRFLFDGFPAIVFSGWPTASYGTFTGNVVAVETSVSENGLFRLLVTEAEGEKPWPKELRMGTGAAGFALLKDVPLWYELWRNINGFPPDYYKPKNKPETTKK